MKNRFQRKDSEFDNETHINRKKKALDTAKIFTTNKNKNKQYKTLECGVEDEDDMLEYEHFLR